LYPQSQAKPLHNGDFAHYSRFDVTTGKVIAGPHVTSIDDLKKFNLPAEMRKMAEQMNESQRAIKTYDLSTFRVQVKGDNILVDV